MDLGKSLEMVLCKRCVFNKSHQEQFCKDGGSRTSSLLKLMHTKNMDQYQFHLSKIDGHYKRNPLYSTIEVRSA